MNIDDHHYFASHNKQQKHRSSVHCLLLLSDTIFCSLSASTIEYHLQKKTSNRANLDSHHNCHHENSSLVDVHALMKENFEIMITLCMKRQLKYNKIMIIVRIQIYEIQRIDTNNTADHSKILRELQRILSLHLRESKNKEYAIISI